MVNSFFVPFGKYIYKSKFTKIFYAVVVSGPWPDLYASAELPFEYDTPRPNKWPQYLSSSMLSSKNI